MDFTQAWPAVRNPLIQNIGPNPAQALRETTFVKNIDWFEHVPVDAFNLGVSMRLINRCVVALGLLLSALTATSASAAIITYDFSVAPYAGPLNGQTYAGWFSFNDSVLTDVGHEEVTLFNGGLSVSFTFEGTTYVSADDPDYPNYPEVTFQDGTLLGLSFLVEGNFSLGASDIFWTDGGSDFRYQGSEPFLSFDVVTYTSRTEQVEVPEPGTLAVLGLGLTGLALVRRRRNA